MSGAVDEPAVPACDPALAALFVPPQPRLGRYEVCASRAAPGSAFEDGFHASGPERLEALDAFGGAGAYDRSRLVQLYGGRRVDVRRGWRLADGRFESLTTLTPFPDPTLSRLDEGTLIVRWILEPPPAARPTAPAASRR